MRDLRILRKIQENLGTLLRVVMLHRKVLAQLLPSVLAFFHYGIKLPQIWWFKTTYVYGFAVL